MNAWLEKERPKLRRTQYSVCTWTERGDVGAVACFLFSALVTYEPAEEQSPIMREIIAEAAERDR